MARRDSPASAVRTPRLLIVIGALVVILLAARSIARLVVDYQWWKELGQLSTWENIIIYSFLPVAIATLLVFVVLWLVHGRALIFAGTRLREYPGYARIATLVILVASFVIVRSNLDNWTIVSFYGARRVGVAANAWRDPIF